VRFGGGEGSVMTSRGLFASTLEDFDQKKAARLKIDYGYEEAIGLLNEALGVRRVFGSSEVEGRGWR
jgi:hypothetical protein